MKIILVTILLFFTCINHIQSQGVSEKQCLTPEKALKMYENLQDWKNAAKTMDKMNSVYKNQKVEFSFDYGKTLFLAERYEEAKPQFEKYINNAKPCEFCNEANLYMAQIKQKNIAAKNTVDISVHEEEKTIIEDIVYEIFEIDEKPEFPGGDIPLFRYISENIQYPAMSKEFGVEGKVYVRFVITKTGDIGEATILRAVDPLLDEEALRLIKTLPQWTPGKNKGKPVNVWYMVPVKFELNYNK